MPRSKKESVKFFTREGIVAEILQEVISAIPKKSKVYIVGGSARNAMYHSLFNKTLRQRDYDLVLYGDLNKFVENLRKNKFIYGKIRRKHQIVLKKKLIPNPESINDYCVLDIHETNEPDILKNLELNSAFSINGFAFPLEHFLDKNFKKYLVALPHAVRDLQNHQLHVNTPGYLGHPSNLFACLRFMSLGFAAPQKEEVKLLLEQLPNIEKWRFERNVKKVFSYVGGEKQARKLAKSLDIKIDIFNLEKLRQFAIQTQLLKNKSLIHKKSYPKSQNL